MDIMIIIGFLLAGISFYIGVPDLRIDAASYLQFESFVLVLGGTLAATAISTSTKEFKSILLVFKQLFFRPKRMEASDAVDVLVKISEKAQVVSKQALADEGKDIDDGFLNRALSLVAAGLDKEFIRNTLETDIAEIQRRHGQLSNLVRSMGTFAPMFGMVGTVMGVVKVLKNVTDIENIVSGMSLALLTTLYGLLLSSLFFIPLTNKLRNKTAKELLVKEMILEGVLMIYDKEIPLKVEKSLTAYLKTTFKKSENQ